MSYITPQSITALVVSAAKIPPAQSMVAASARSDSIEQAVEVARVESLRGRMSEAGRQAEGLFESLLVQSFEIA